MPENRVAGLIRLLESDQMPLNGTGERQRQNIIYLDRAAPGAGSDHQGVELPRAALQCSELTPLVAISAETTGEFSNNSTPKSRQAADKASTSSRGLTMASSG